MLEFVGYGEPWYSYIDNNPLWDAPVDDLSKVLGKANGIVAKLYVLYGCPLKLNLLPDYVMGLFQCKEILCMVESRSLKPKPFRMVSTICYKVPTQNGMSLLEILTRLSEI